jgi:hypothetical protein
MSNEATLWGRPITGISGTEKAILMYLCDRHNMKLGYAFPSQARMAAETCYGKRTISRAIASLINRGLIVSQRTYFQTTLAPGSNRYFFPEFAPEDVPKSLRPVYIGGDWNPDGKWDREVEDQ